MKKIIIAILAFMLIFSNFNCTKKFEEMNKDPNAVANVNPAYFFAPLTQAVYNNYQRNWNLYADLYSQYWANTVEGFPSPQYGYHNPWIGNLWEEFYTQHLRRSLGITEMVGDDPAYTNMTAMNDILICFWWARMTDYYGDIPYFGAGKGESVPYNSQRDIYYDLFERLDIAIKSITNDASQFTPEGSDLIYGGNVMKWQKFGNSLRLRLAMRLSNVEPAKAQTEATAAVNGTGGLMTSNDDVAHVPMWSGGWYDYLQQMGWSWNNISCSKTMLDYLYSEVTGTEDPRTPIWFAYQEEIDKEKVAVTKEFLGLAEYFGLENGHSRSTMPSGDYATINLEGGYIGFSGEGEDNSMYNPIMFYSEVLFLQAEAVLRGWISGDANSLYKQGVSASMDFVGVSSSDADTYVTALSNLTGSNEEQLKQIITQKWIAGFPNGAEGWADFRRTDYPDLSLPFAGVSSSSSVAPGTWVKRIRYPDNQHNVNEVNMPAALNSSVTDRMDIKVWWDVADTKSKTGGLMSTNF